MPENQPPGSDPFADLYSRLPDPRTGARSADGSADAAPPSRRAAREARRAQTGPTDTNPAAEAPAANGAATPAPRFDVARRAPGETAGNGMPEPTRAADSAPAPRAAEPAPRAAEPTPAPRAAEPAARAPEPAPAPRSADAGVTASAPASSGALRDGGEAAPGPGRTGAPSTTADGARRPSASADAPRDAEPALVGAGVGTAGRTAPAGGGIPSGSLEDLFTGQTTTHEIGQSAPRPPKKRRRIGGWIALAVVLVLLGGLAAGGAVVWNTYGDRIQAFLGNGEPLDYEAGQAKGEARITIVSGDTGESVSPKLFEAGVTKASNSLYKYMVDNSVAFTFQPGVYKLQQQMTSEAVLAALRDPASRLNYSVQLREGLTLTQSLDVIAEQLGLPRADLDAAVADPSAYGVPASTLEGWIFPATYDFDEGVTAQQVIERMVQRTIQSLDAAGVPETDRERILIVASIIEREARSSEDFYKVSRVIENRLQPDNTETHGLLQMDSTAQYGAGELDAGSSSSSENALTSDNPWNTYIRPGLPIGPIANPGDLAIDAAMKPVDGPWYYFTTVNLATGETVFSTTYADQLKAVDQFRAWCRDNPDGGC
ncbi:endolytic transglycosylase MltG [uncultured Microbacterium sp.]|uniref:endolytic transglycosylase MltG n=1 Tax=uncultured Microbacterium sp. TaxID=191216 RepID=UPI0026382F15|nr:endolytic transglycosylase MltG [uncultured Microbacterium sp.]